jgi:hypothetical protein
MLADLSSVEIQARSEDGGEDGKLKVEGEEDCGSLGAGGVAGGVVENPSSFFKNLSMTNTQGNSQGFVEEPYPLAPLLSCIMVGFLAALLRHLRWGRPHPIHEPLQYIFYALIDVTVRLNPFAHDM